MAAADGVGEPDGFIAAKLRSPRVAAHSIERPRLVRRIDDAVQSLLTLLIGPAGSGKSTLVAQWLSRTEHDVAYLALDAVDDDPARFVGYLLAAVRAVEPAVGAGAEVLARSSNPRRPELMLADHLVIPLDRRTRPLVLVLEDLHQIDGPEIYAGLAWLLEHAPACLRVLIVSRVAPPLPLSRLDAAGLLQRVDASELRFTHEEAGAMLRALGCALDATALTDLERRTEGWAVALRLSAVSMAGSAQAVGAQPAGRDALTGYLMDEVLSTLPEALQRFLLCTAVVERFDASLAAALLEADDAGARLARIEEHNPLLIAIGDGWYRYHHLFGEFLRARLERTQPALVPTLHARAARWLADRDNQDDAMAHAVASQDDALLLSLIARFGGQRLTRFETRKMLTWIEALAPELRDGLPWLLVFKGVALLLTGRLSDARRTADRALELFEERRGLPAPHRAVVMNGDVAEAAARKELEEYRALVECLALYYEGNTEEAYHAAHALLEREDSIGPATLSSALCTAGVAAYAHRGDVEAGIAHLERGYRVGRAQGRSAIAVAAAADLVLILRREGRLDDAKRWYEVVQADERAEPSGAEASLGRLEVELSGVILAEGDAASAVDIAERGLSRIVEAGDVTSEPFALHACARARWAAGDADGARSLWADAEGVLRRTELRPLLLDMEGLRAELSATPPARVEPSDRAPVLLEELTQRELEILAHAGGGLSNREIASRLAISVATVKTHMHRAMHKLDAPNRTAATHRARQLGLIG